MKHLSFIKFNQPIHFFLLGASLLSLTLMIIGAKNEQTTQTKAAGGRIFYVSPTGNDANDGLSLQTAFQTLNKINTLDLEPGDNVLLESGKSFSGKLYLDPNDNGTPEAPIIVTTTGSEKATITNSDIALYSYNSSGIEIKNLKVTGTGRTNNNKNGILFYNDFAGNVTLPHIKITSVETSGWGDNGVMIAGGNGTSGYSDVSLTSVISHDNGRAGIATYAPAMYAHKNVYIGYSQAYNNSGIPGQTFNTGNGIVIGSVDGGIIERSIAHTNGWLNQADEGPVGIWAWNSNNVTIQNNESYNNKTGSNADGDGFDLDINVTNSKMQYNYSHDNDGAGFLIGAGNSNYSGNIIRYNISQNDARKLKTGSIVVWGNVKNTRVYNNTIYTKYASSNPRGIMIANWGYETTAFPDGLYVENNIIYTDGGAVLLEATAEVARGMKNIFFRGNNYFTNGSTQWYVWGSTSYSSLSSWRTATSQEKLNGANTGYNVNPLLTSPGAGVNGYKLQSTSPMKNTGLNLKTLFSIDPGTHDFYDITIPQGNNYDIGAHEFPITSPTSAPTSIPTATVIPTIKPTATPTPTATGNGLTGYYFANKTLSGTATVTRIDPSINFNWGTGSPHTTIPTNSFSTRWTGFVVPKYSQTYTFYTMSDDGVRLWVNGVQLINNWTNHASTENKGTITLTAGRKYSIKMEYYENTGNAIAGLFWSSSSQAKQAIPQSALFTR